MCTKVSYSSFPYLQHFLGGLDCFIIGCPPLQVILVPLAVHALMDGLAQEAIHLAADGAVELVHLILIETEPLTVGGAAVVAVGSHTLSLLQTSLVQLQKLLRSNQLHVCPKWECQRSSSLTPPTCASTYLPDLPLCQWNITLIPVIQIHVWAFYLSVWAVHYGTTEAVSVVQQKCHF